jgi:hypothetical protein
MPWIDTRDAANKRLYFLIEYHARMVKHIEKNLFDLGV